MHVHLYISCGGWEPACSPSYVTVQLPIYLFIYNNPDGLYSNTYYKFVITHEIPPVPRWTLVARGTPPSLGSCVPLLGTFVYTLVVYIKETNTSLYGQK